MAHNVGNSVVPLLVGLRVIRFGDVHDPVIDALPPPWIRHAGLLKRRENSQYIEGRSPVDSAFLHVALVGQPKHTLQNLVVALTKLGAHFKFNVGYNYLIIWIVCAALRPSILTYNQLIESLPCGTRPLKFQSHSSLQRVCLPCSKPARASRSSRMSFANIHYLWCGKTNKLREKNWLVLSSWCEICLWIKQRQKYLKT